MKDFWKTPAVINYVVDDLFDIDEIVMRLGSCPNEEEYIIVRNYYFWEWDGGDDWHIEYTTKEGYEKYKDNDDYIYRTDLNYKDFEDKFWFDTFEETLTQYAEPSEQLDFISCVNETFFTLNFESQAKMFLKNIITGLTELNQNLKRFIRNRDKEYGEKINKIQEIVINQYSGSYLNTKEKIIQKYKFIYPEIENNFNPSGTKINTKPTRDEILKKLIGDNINLNKFNEYEKKLKSHKYITIDNVWNKGSANLQRFYLHCEKQKIFKSQFLADDSRGIEFLRQLYDFHKGKAIDSRSKRLKQLTPTTKLEFDFLDIK